MSVSDDDIASMIDEEIIARRAKAMFLKNAGATLSKIAEETGVSVSTVRKDLMIVRRDINNEPPIDVIARHRAVIFDIQRANYPAMMRGDKDAAATILRALDREAKLLGLDQPVKLLAAVSNEDFANEAARLIERINALDPSTLKELERVREREATVIEGEVEQDPEPAADADGDTRDAQPAHGGQGDADQAEPTLRAVAAVDLDTDGQAADPPERVAELPRPAGQAKPGADPDNDDDWSNI